MQQEIKVKRKLSGDKEISIETGLLAQLADGAVVVRMGDAMLLATVVSNKDPKEGIDFLPLSVDYQEKFAANGKIPGGFLKREGRLSEYEILISRLIDRALRPLFPENFRCETQVMVSLISADKEVLPDALACLAASAAIMLSDIPFDGPVAEVRVARVSGEFKVNPSVSEIEYADINLMVAGTLENIVMVEGEMDEVSEEEMAEAIKFAHEQIKSLCILQTDLVTQRCKKETRTVDPVKEDTVLKGMLHEWGYPKLYDIAVSESTKNEKKEGFEKIKELFISQLPEESGTENEKLISRYFDDLVYEVVRHAIVDKNIRLDNRSSGQIRPIWSIVNYLPSAHGSAIFTRGETQSLTTVTLGNKRDEQLIDSAMYDGYNKFMLHYNFPPFCTGEAKPNRGSSRREIGHGNLAMRTIRKVLPPEDQFPYTIRVVSDILQSNGSSSMATVCAGSMALMDAGVPTTKPVAGIAMGLIAALNQFVVLSDILGDEDHLGDMDFKVTGTKDGICACQMDIKVKGLSYDVLLKALHQAKEGRLHILNEMSKTINTHREAYKPHVPKIVRLSIPKEFIGAVIGSGGKNIQELQKRTNTIISVEEKEGFGQVEILSADVENMRKAQEYIMGLTEEPEIGKNYKGMILELLDFGAMIEFLPGKKGLLHVSEIDWVRVENINDYFKEGDIVEVKLLDIDRNRGKFRLSRKVLIPGNTKIKEDADTTRAN